MAKHHQRRKYKVKCMICGKPLYRWPSEIHKRNFCSLKHMREWLRTYDKTENPMNKKGGWTMESRLKRRELILSKCKDENKTYKKYLGRHIHRVMAEKKLGRPLRKGEVVHHIDGNKCNNKLSNLMILPSNAAHSKLHAELRKKQKKRPKKLLKTERFKKTEGKNGNKKKSSN